MTVGGWVGSAEGQLEVSPGGMWLRDTVYLEPRAGVASASFMYVTVSCVALKWSFLMIVLLCLPHLGTGVPQNQGLRLP